MRFKLLPIFAALLLLCGCGGARTLADVSGCGQWSRVQIIEWYEQGGSAGTQLPADTLSPDTLRELLGNVRPADGKKPKIAVITGAEGGFAAEEAEMAAQAGAKTVGLGPRILRCETAPLAVLSAVMTLTGNLE